jgi:hypothetical protein
MRALTTLRLLLVCSPLAGARRIEVPQWTDDAGYCKPILENGALLDSGIHRVNGLYPIDMRIGDVLVFVYSTHHNVWLHSSEASYTACTYADGVELANRTDGGGCENEADLACMAAASGFEWHPQEEGTFHFSCSVGDHCVNGQRLAVTVHAHSYKPPPASSITVPDWTDDAGYCSAHHLEQAGRSPDDRRPNGLAPITLLQGQELVFKYSIYHDVWAHPSREALEACDFSSAVQLAGTLEGGGCERDDDLECIAASEGYALRPTQDEMYLSCGVHDHCANGQRLVVTVLPLPLGSAGGAPGSAGGVDVFDVLDDDFGQMFGAAILAALLTSVAGAALLHLCGRSRSGTPLVRSIPGPGTVSAAQHGV